MKCPVCGETMRQGVEEEDGPGGPIPTEHYLYCPGCRLNMTGTAKVINTLKEKLKQLRGEHHGLQTKS